MAPQLQIEHLPPYGFLCAESAKDALRIPAKMGEDYDGFHDLVLELAEELAKHVWPIFDRSSSQWIGDARESAIALTRADLEVGSDLAALLSEKISSEISRVDAKTHEKLFLEEDCFVINEKAAKGESPFVIWGASFSDYAYSVDEKLCKDLAVAFDVDGCKESGGLSLALKIMMQRPRPYQVALLLNQIKYENRKALTSQTPALVSGHALQSAIAGCYVVERFEKELNSVEGLLGSWSQFVMDVGDRRVFAGVHYPSDCVASWFCAHRFAKKFYEPNTRKFLWEAVRGKSRVYAAIAEHAAKNRHSPYRPLLEWLRGEAES